MNLFKVNDSTFVNTELIALIKKRKACDATDFEDVSEIYFSGSEAWEFRDEKSIKAIDRLVKNNINNV